MLTQEDPVGGLRVKRELQATSLPRRVEEGPSTPGSREFKARIRYLASSLIVTIPARVAREMGLRLGDMVVIMLRKEATQGSRSRSPASSP
jgi:hypothetical protein